MIVQRARSLGILGLLGLILPLVAPAEEPPEWNQARVTTLAGQLHAGVKGLQVEIQSLPRDSGSMRASAYYRLRDSLRLIERESRYLHKALESGEGRDETLPAYARIALLRRDCAEEMRRQPLAKPALERITRARSIVKQMDPYYGFDPERPDHDRVLQR